MIYIKPYFHLNRLELDSKKELKQNFLWGDRDHLFFISGKKAIHFLINKLALKREDEVCIFTTTNSNYVSTCVSATIFNYCKISRVISEKTKLIYVIHEFGFPFNEIKKLADTARKMNIPLVEDCAHTMDSHLGGQRVGTFGDYAIYSISKHLPIENCGLLVGDNLEDKNKELYNPNLGNQLEKEYLKYLPYLFTLSNQKIVNARKIYDTLTNLTPLFEISEGITPHLAIFKSTYFEELYSLTKEDIESHPLHVKNWFAMTTQPMMTFTEINKIAEDVNNFIMQKRKHE